MPVAVTMPSGSERMVRANDPFEQLMHERAGRPEVRAEFHAQLEDLEQQLVSAAEQVGAAIQPVTRAFLRRDHAAAEAWAEQNQRLSADCRQLEEDGYTLLARQSPVAGDLRRIIAVLRHAADVQRTGDLLRHVVASLSWIDPLLLPSELRDLIEEFGQLVSGLVQQAVDAWDHSDSLAALDLARADDEVDRLQRELLAALCSGTCSVEEGVSLALLARYYERMGDHAVELARGVTYAVTGERLVDH